MKKIILSLLAAVTSILLAFSLVACNKTENEGDNNSSSTNGMTSSTETTTDITAEKWAELLENANQYTLLRTVEGYTYRSKLDGDKLIIDGTEYQIISKEGDNYYLYSDHSDIVGSRSFVRESLSAEEYEGIISAYANLLKTFSNDFALFSEESGIYTCASIDKTETMNAVFTNVEVTIRDGALIDATFVVDNIQYEFTDIGETTIELPTKFIDFASSKDEKISEEE